MKLSIRTKLIIITALIVITSMSVLSLIFYWKASDYLNSDVKLVEDILNENIYKVGQLSVEVATNQALTWLMKKQELVRQFSSTPLVVEAIKNIPKSTLQEKLSAPYFNNLYNYLIKVYNNNNMSGIKNLFVGSNISGELYSSARAMSPATYEVRGLNWFKLGMNIPPNEAAFTAPYTEGTLYDATVVAVVSPVKNEKNEIIGVAGVHINIFYWLKMN